ncbi:MAG: hypothetical protein KIC56_02115 [Clostridium sp.]|jgi:hypothetical protein|nr:hypothetical protein [Clostridium sp.]
MDIEENIKILENLKKYLNLLIYEGTHKIIYNDLGWDEKTIDCINAIAHILAEREEDKKRIEELEKENKRKDMFVKMAKEVIEESILKQKIKEKIKDLEYNSSLGFEETLEESYKIEVLQELLEDK